MTPFEAIGWLGNACFFSRWIVQWLASERSKKSAAPRSFFWLSLAGTTALFTYTLHRGELVLLAGLAANFVFYVRNLLLRRGVKSRPSPAIAAGLIVLTVLLAVGGATGQNEASTSAWLVCGIAGQSIKGSRFALQWWLSERRGESHFPPVFWYLSLAGSLLVLAYAAQTGNWIWIVGDSTSWLIPLRNIVLMRRAAGGDDAPQASAVGGP